MLEVISWFILFLITHMLDCYIFSKLNKEKINFNIKVLALIVVFSIIDCIFQTINVISKILISNIITIVILKLIYKKSISKTIIGTIFIYLSYVLYEIIFCIVCILILKLNPEIFQTKVYGIVIVNLLNFIFCFLIFNIKVIDNFVYKIMNWYDDKKILKLALNSLLIIVLCYALFYNLVLQKYFFNYQFFIICIFLGIIVFIVGYFNEKSNINKLTVEYTQLLEYVKDYEKEVVEKGKRQHEYKNQLIVINDMIPKTNKKLKKYVEDKLKLEKNIKDNIWLEKLTNLPSGGIKGLIYFKLKRMLYNKIDVYIEIDEKLSDNKKWFNVDKYLEDYTRILGVYLDNAIEASSDSKNKQIILEFKDNDDNIEFILSNTYEGIIRYDEIDKESFSTKGNGRGYGLALVKDIISKNKLLSQSREINGKFYVQKLTIKK